MIRLELTDAQSDELLLRTREAGIAPRTRDRLRMIRLADARWTIPHIARHEQTARKYVKSFLAAGFGALTARATDEACALLTEIRAAREPTQWRHRRTSAMMRSEPHWLQAVASPDGNDEP
jgi:hypothetical protein